MITANTLKLYAIYKQENKSVDEQLELPFGAWFVKNYVRLPNKATDIIERTQSVEMAKIRITKYLVSSYYYMSIPERKK